MKIGVISQRIDTIESYGEIRDAIDVNWHALFMEMGAALIPLGNEPANLDDVLDRICPDFIVLSGGNTPVAYGGSAPNRDEVDRRLIGYSVERQCPLLGVCRGMQSIALYYGSTLKKVEGHVSVRHDIQGQINRSVNSYHGYAVDKLGEELNILAKTSEDSIEAICHKELPIYGIMWHPERVKGFDLEDIDLIKKWLSI